MTPITARPDYAGDIDSRETWDLMKKEPRAQLIDVRTRAEWAYVGLPDLGALGREVVCLEWQRYPEMAVDPDFVAKAAAQLDRAGADKDTPVFLLCRSGARSASAAKAMTAAGYARAYNISDGFEGGLDGERHRGKRNGWKAAGLPWRQS